MLTRNYQNRQNAGNNNSRNPFRPYSSNRFPSRPFSAYTYQHDVTNDNDAVGAANKSFNDDDKENYIPNDQEQYNTYEDVFYQGAIWAQSQPTQSNQHIDGMQEPKDVDHDDTVELNFITTKLMTTFKCRRCYAVFTSNNQLHRHLRTGCDITATNAPAELVQETPITAMTPDTIIVTPSRQVIASDSSDVTVEGYAFRGYQYVTTMVAFLFGGILYKLCFDTGCTMSLIDRKFLFEIFPKTILRKMPTPMKVKGIGDRKHDACEYIKLKMYLPSPTGKTALIDREFHVVDNLTAKALIGIDIMKPKGIVIDLGMNIMKIGACKDLLIPIDVTSKGARVNTTIFSRKGIILPPHTNVPVLVTGAKRPLSLPTDRDFIFEPNILDTLLVYAHVVDYNMSEVFIRNDTDYEITLPRRTRLGNVTEYDAAGAFAVDPDQHDLAMKAPKRL